MQVIMCLSVWGANKKRAEAPAYWGNSGHGHASWVRGEVNLILIRLLDVLVGVYILTIVITYFCSSFFLLSLFFLCSLLLTHFGETPEAFGITRRNMKGGKNDFFCKSIFFYNKKLIFWHLFCFLRPAFGRWSLNPPQSLEYYLNNYV